MFIQGTDFSQMGGCQRHKKTRRPGGLAGEEMRDTELKGVFLVVEVSFDAVECEVYSQLHDY